MHTCCSTAAKSLYTAPHILIWDMGWINSAVHTKASATTPSPLQSQQYMPAGGCGCDRPVIQDYGPAPFVMDIEEAAMQNNTFRTALWTGKHLQVTLMSIRPGEDIGLEIHPELDQFIRIENGHGIVMMGDTKDRLDFRRHVNDDYIIIIPAGKWHNLINTGHEPIKLYSIYAPPNIRTARSTRQGRC